MTKEELWEWALKEAEKAPRLSEEQRELLRPLLRPHVEAECRDLPHT